MSCRRAFTVAAACVALGACNTLSSPNRNIGMEDPYFGESFRYNAAVQTINPDPVYAANGAQPGDNGDKGAQAVKRYRTDQVKSPQSDSGSSNGGLGGGVGGSVGPR
jgi:hypothetical protein